MLPNAEEVRRSLSAIRQAALTHVATLIGIAVALLVAALGLWLGNRRADQIIGPELAQALRLEKTDPAASRQLLDDYFKRQAAREERERALLWQQVPTSLEAAKELRRRLIEDLATGASAQREFKNLTASPGKLMKQVEASAQDVRLQVAQLDDIIQRLQVG